MKTRIAQICNEQYGSSYKAEDITDCDGCREESGTLFTGCSNCEIRRCARERKFETCAHCPEYACGNLQKLFETDPNAKIRLDIIKSVI